MQLRDIALIHSGHLSRGKIDPHEDGSHFLLQARDADADRLDYRANTLIRFNPDLSRNDLILKREDILFMARGDRNFSVLLQGLPEPTLAAACFFIIRGFSEDALPGYLWWYLNQPPAEQYLIRHSGRGVHMPVVRRSVLEKIDIPLPSIEIQRSVTELDAVRRQEKRLAQHMIEKRKELVTAICLQAIKERK